MVVRMEMYKLIAVIYSSDLLVAKNGEVPDFQV